MGYTRTYVLLAVLTALLLAAGALLAGRGGLLMAGAFAIVINVGAYWFSDQLVLKWYKAQPANEQQAPELFAIVKALSQKGHLPMPKVYIIENDAPNAFATGRNPDNAVVAATTGLLRLLDRNELTGVMAHELAHVRNRDTLIGTISATIAGAIAALASMAKWGVLLGGRGGQRGGHPIAILLMAIIAPIAAGLVQMAISRTREFAADQAGAYLCGNPLWLASALKKIAAGNERTPMREAYEHPTAANLFIINPFKSDKIGQLFSTHPALDERIKRLENMKL